MVVKELEKLIANASNPSWFSEDAQFTFPLRSSTGELTKKGLISIYRYVLGQIKGFESLEGSLPSVLDSSKKYFTNLKSNIDAFINNYLNNDIKELDSQWRQVITRLSQFLSQNVGNRLMDFDSPEVEFLINLQKENSAYVQAAFSFLCSETVNAPDRPENLIGAIKAYNFRFEENSGVKNKKSTEKISLGLLRSSFNQILDDIQKNHNENLKSEIDKSKEFSKSIDLLKEEKESKISEWFNKSQSEFSYLSKGIEDRHKELEKTYEELLRLKKPAEYWSIRAKKLKEDGKKYLEQLMWLISIGGILIFFLLWKVPDGLMLNIFRGEASAIKWTLLYITMISFVIFGIKTLAKITYSSFHLARDAEEREQLTYVYLSLKNESGVEEKDRQIILQSLFSRSDTGLLKDDSSPTMPGIIDSVLKNNR